MSKFSASFETEKETPERGRKAGPVIDRLFLGATRTDRMVGRLELMGQLMRAVTRPAAGRGCQLVYVLGAGGMGKSRLVEELGILYEKKKLPKTTPNGSQLVVAPIIDMSQTSLHMVPRLEHEIFKKLVEACPEIDFEKYEKEHREFLRSEQMSSEKRQSARTKAEEAFIECYRRAAETMHLVLILDTCERLSYSQTSWLVDRGLLQSEDLPFIAQWLTIMLQSGSLPNTTLVLAGRKKEGQAFYDQVSSGIPAAGKGAKKVALEKILVSGFTRNETCEYFTLLAEEWHEQARADQRQQATAREFADLASDPDRLEVLWRYTGGQPVRLSLYSDLIIDGRDLPKALTDSPAAARQKVPDEFLLGDPERFEARAAPVQKAIEAELTRLMFDLGSMRAQILSILVRAPRGLTGDQLYYLVYKCAVSSTREDEKIALLEQEWNALSKLAIIKKRPNDRLGLQDEMYHIYAQVMWADEQVSSPKEWKRYTDEVTRRAEQHRRLEQYASARLVKALARRREFIDKDESSMLAALRNPAEALNLALPRLPEGDEVSRHTANDEVDLWEKERLHYRLLLDMPETMNTELFDLGYRKDMALTLDDFSAIEEIYQVLYDPDILRFILIKPWESLVERGETPVDAMRRLLEQQEVTRWLARFVMRDHDRAKVFYHKIDEMIDRLPDETPAQQGAKRSWRHTFSRGERDCWFHYMRILEGQEIYDAIEKLRKIADEFNHLLKKQISEVAYPGEHGFRGHPGYQRLMRVLSLVYNNLGYGYVTVGQLTESVNHYALALKHIRATDTRVRMSTVLNNLSRALSDRGRERARRVCLDGLELRKSEGTLVPIAYSLNTLALIDNDQLRPDLAWIEAAMAAAYFTVMKDQRGLGLAYNQLGEALRRLVADSRLTGRLLADNRDSILNTAENALELAEEIFSRELEGRENVRLIETLIELGCLRRDRLIYIDEKGLRQQAYNRSLNNLTQAARLANRYRLPRLILDAEVNRAWTYYYFYNDRPAEAIQQATGHLSQIMKMKYTGREKELDLIPANALITETTRPEPGSVESYLFQQLSKMYGLRGKIAMDEFKRRVDALEDNPANQVLTREALHALTRGDTAAQECLKAAAEHYVLALAYAQLYSPRSGALTAIYDQLYDRLKAFNADELTSFYQYQSEQRARYHLEGGLRMEDLGDPGKFIHECVGDFEERDL